MGVAGKGGGRERWEWQGIVGVAGKGGSGRRKVGVAGRERKGGAETVEEEVREKGTGEEGRKESRMCVCGKRSKSQNKHLQTPTHLGQGGVISQLLCPLFQPSLHLLC